MSIKSQYTNLRMLIDHAEQADIALELAQACEDSPEDIDELRLEAAHAHLSAALQLAKIAKVPVEGSETC